MNIQHCYKILNSSPESTDEAITHSYKKLAQKYHPDRNRNNLQWAHEAMTSLNIAYSTLMSYRFENPSTIRTKEKPAAEEKKKEQPRAGETVRQKPFISEIEEEYLIQSFIKLRESAKESLYRFFQYGLNNIARRETGIQSWNLQ